MHGEGNRRRGDGGTVGDSQMVARQSKRGAYKPHGEMKGAMRDGSVFISTEILIPTGADIDVVDCFRVILCTVLLESVSITIRDARDLAVQILSVVAVFPELRHNVLSGLGHGITLIFSFRSAT